MNVSVVGESLERVRADAVVVGVYAEEKKLREPAARVNEAAGGALADVLDAEKFQGKVGGVTHLHVNGKPAARRVVIVGLGRRADMTAEIVRRAAAAGLRRARDLGARAVAIEVLGDRLPARQRAHAVVEGAILGTYTFDRYKREKSEKQVDSLQLVEPDGRQRREAAEGARRGEIFAEATWFARDLVNAPANDVNPTHLAKVAQDIAKAGGVRVEILDAAACRKLGMGMFLGVAAGSEQPPKFIHLAYVPSGRRRKKVAVIGKGITFDSGGLDLKSAEGMLRMKDDMSGAAAVLGLMRALPALKPAVEVHGLIAATRPWTSTAGFSSGRARMTASTAAAPDMSSFMRSMPSAVLRSRPPASKVMPLPMMAIFLRAREGA